MLYSGHRSDLAVGLVVVPSRPSYERRPEIATRRCATAKDMQVTHHH